MVLTEAGAIAALIRSTPDTSRKTAIEEATLSDLRKKVEKQLIAELLGRLQARGGGGAGVKCGREVK